MSHQQNRLTHCQKAGDYFYDFSAAIISVIDVVTDVLVTYEFWQLGRKVYFGIAVGIFVLAQFMYSVLFTMAYGENLRRTRSQALCFMCIFPIAQIVPLFMWLDSMNFAFIKKILKTFHLSQNVIDINRQCPKNKDPLQFWLEQKFMSHGGFMIEAAIEAFPQSIVQMIGIVMFQEATPLNVVSIIVSMTSVASKMLMFSYSIDRVTFLFNFFCFVADIFGIFCTQSWVFYHPEENDGYDTFNSFTVAGQVWILKILSMVALCFVIAFLFGISAAFLTCTRNFCTKGKRKYLQCFPCCSYRRRAAVHANNHTNSACHNCKINCIFCCFLCKTCCIEMCRCRQRNAQNIAPRATKKPFCDGLRKKMKSCSLRKCGRKSWDFLVGIFALIALLCVVGMVPIAAVFLFGIAVMALEIARLCIIPFLFYDLDSSKHRSNVKFYKPIFEYLMNGQSKSDYYVRLAIVNYECCWEWAQKSKYIKCAINDMTNDKKIYSDFIHGLSTQQSQWMDWMKALLIPNTFTKYHLRKRKLGKLKKERRERRLIEWDLAQNDPDRALSLKTKANKKDSKDEDEIVELKVSDTQTNTAERKEEKYEEEEEEEEKYTNLEMDTTANAMVDVIPSAADLMHQSAEHDGLAEYKKREKKNREMESIPDIADDEIEKLEQLIKQWDKRKEAYSDKVITKYIGDNPHNIVHLLDVKPKDYRRWTQNGPIYFLRVVFIELVHDAWKEVIGDSEFKNVNVCGRIMVFLSLFALCFGIYILLPFGCLLLLLSLFYPIIALILTYFLSGIAAIHYLQLSLTIIYVFVLLSILMMIPRVYKFQHANFHFYASRRNLYSTNAITFPPRKQKFALKYISLYATMRRNEIINDFWGDLAPIFMTFLSPTQNIEVKVKDMGFNNVVREYDDEHIRMLEKEIIKKENNERIKRTLLDYMD